MGPQDLQGEEYTLDEDPVDHQDYGSQVWAPSGQPGDLRAQESPLRAFTKRMANLHHLHYWDRLLACGLSSTERRQDRYRVLYLWKVMMGLVPNFGITWREDGRRGIQVRLPPLSGSRMAVRTLRDRAFHVEAPKLWNSLPPPSEASRGLPGHLQGSPGLLPALCT